MDDDQWKQNATDLLEAIGGEEPYQMRILSGTMSGIRATLGGSRFKAMRDDDLTTTIAIAITLIRGGDGTEQ